VLVSCTGQKIPSAKEDAIAMPANAAYDDIVVGAGSAGAARQRTTNHWAQLGNRGWSYQDVVRIIKKMKRYESGSDRFRGRDGLLRITDTPRNKVPLLEKIIEGASARLVFRSTTEWRDQGRHRRIAGHDRQGQPPARGGCLDHADAGERRHQCAGYHDRREMRRLRRNNRDWEDKTWEDKTWEDKILGCNEWTLRHLYKRAAACAGSRNSMSPAR